jgi:soluble lytic murein transglycosylase-like protein
MADPLASSLANYSPGVRSAYRRSRYLEDALAAMRESTENPRSIPEVGLKLLAQAITEKKSRKADSALALALQGDQAAAAKPTLDWMARASQPQAQAVAPASPPPAPPPPAPMQPQAPQPKPQGGVDPAMWGALEHQESGGRQSAVSPKGAFGVAQLMPDTAMEMAKRMGNPQLAEQARTDPNVNRQLGQGYLQEQMQKYGSPVLALAAYNAGPGRVDEWLQKIGDPRSGRISEQDWAARIPFPETRNYVANIMRSQSQPGGGMQPPVQGPPGGMETAQQAPPPQAPPQPPQQQPIPPQPRGPTAEEVQIFQDAYANPQTRQQAIQYGQQLREKYAAPQKFETQMINGVPAWLDPTKPGSMQMGQVPQEAMTRDAPPPPGMTPGTVGQRDPSGGYKVLQQPPQGYQGTPQSQTYVRGGPADPSSGQNLVQGEDKLRTEYTKQVQPFVEARNGYQKVLAAAKDGTGASDIALIFGFMKTLDPGSTVREGEYATAQNSGSVSQTIQNLYNKALTGQKLQPEQRAQFAQTARQQFQVYQQQADQLNQRYGSMAQSYGYDPARVVQALPPVEELKPAQSADPWSKATPAQLKAAQQFRGSKAPIGTKANPVAIFSKEQYDKLPRGTVILDDDGWIGPKP